MCYLQGAFPLDNNQFLVAGFENYISNNKLKPVNTFFLYNRTVGSATTFRAEGFPAPSETTTYDPLQIQRCEFMYLNQVIDRPRNRWLVPLRRYMNCVPGDSLFENDPLPVAGYFDLKNPDAPFRHLNVKHPPTEGDGYYTGEHKDAYVLVTAGGDYLFSFAHTDQMRVLNPETESLRELRMGSVLFDRIPFTQKPVEPAPYLPYPKVYPSYDESLGKYFPPIYDPYRRLYYRLVRQQPVEPLAPAAYSLILADTAFRVIGEALLPDELVPPYDRFALFPAPDGLYCWNPARTSAYDDRYVFTRLDFKPTRKPAAKTLRRQLAQRAAASRPQGRGLADYLRQKHQLTLENEAVLLVPVDNSCASCKDFVLRYYADSVLATGATGPRLLLLGANATAIERTIAEHGLAPYRERILTDPRRLALRYVPEWINPRWVVVRGGQLATDAVLNPTEIYTLPNRVRRWRMGE